MILNLESAVGSRFLAQAFDALSKIKKRLITNKVNTLFLISLCTSKSCTVESNPNANSRLNLIFLLIMLLSHQYVHAMGESKSWRFDVYLDDKYIGEQEFIVDYGRDKTTVDISASFDVKFLFFNAYQYRHKNEEIWKGQCLHSIRASTDDNGTDYIVNGNRVDNNFVVTSNDKKSTLNGCIHSFSYWDKNIVEKTQLLNSQTGELENITVTNKGLNEILLHNKSVSAEHYILQTKSFELDLWYSSQGEWLSLRSKTEDGNILNYKLRSH